MSIHQKYTKALDLFKSTDLSRKEICLICNLKASEFGAYLRRHHRDLVIQRINKNSDIKLPLDAKLHGKCGPGLLSRIKYVDAIKACHSIDFIEYNISQVARYFKLDPTGLGNQLRAHYPDILEWRYNEQIKRGLNTYQQQYVQKISSEQYANAIELLRNSRYTIKEIAEKCNVSFSGLRQHVLFYHKDLVRKRRKIREKNIGQKYKGMQTGTNTIHKPNPETVLKYAESLDLYCKTPMTMKEIIKKTGVPYGGFYRYIRTWHRDLIAKRRGIICKEDVEVANFCKYKHYLASTFNKYTDAITYLKKNDVTIAAAARSFSLHPETFRKYLKEHEPELLSSRGMMVTPEGKYVSRRSYKKYKAALDLYRTTSESLYSIAKRTGNNIISLGSFIRRNYPEYIALHKKSNKKDE